MEKKRERGKEINQLNFGFVFCEIESYYTHYYFYLLYHKLVYKSKDRNLTLLFFLFLYSYIKTYHFISHVSHLILKPGGVFTHNLLNIPNDAVAGNG